MLPLNRSGVPAVLRARSASFVADLDARTADDEAIEAVLRGHVQRYAELVDRYQQTAWRIAYSFVGNAEDAKELSQNGFVKAYQHLAKFRRHAKFSTWLYRIIANECKDFFKRKARRPSTLPLGPRADGGDEPLFEVADRAADPREAMANRELANRLTAAIRQLPDKQQQAFILHHLHGLPFEEAADIMACRVGTVKAHVFRACERLRGELAPYVKTEVRQ